MTKEVKVDEYGYIPRYQNMSYEGDTKMHNDLQDKMSALYCKWYGSAYGLSSEKVDSLKEAIKKGKTTFNAWKRNFEDEAYKGITGHTLTEERQRKKEQKIKEQKPNIRAIIVGRGELKDNIESYIKANNLTDNLLVGLL